MRAGQVLAEEVQLYAGLGLDLVQGLGIVGKARPPQWIGIPWRSLGHMQINAIYSPFSYVNGTVWNKMEQFFRVG